MVTIISRLIADLRGNAKATTISVEGTRLVREEGENDNELTC